MLASTRDVIAALQFLKRRLSAPGGLRFSNSLQFSGPLQFSRTKFLPVVLTAALAACSGGVSTTNTSSAVTASQLSVGGTVSGLKGSTLVLQNNGGDELSVTANGTFKFATPLITGNDYRVTVVSQPASPSQTCVVTNASGTVTGSDVADITVTCADKTTLEDTIGGTTTGLLGSGLVLQDNNGDNLGVAADGSFVFATALPNGMPYAVSVLSPPINPYQNCVVTNGAGTATGDVTNVLVTCTTNTNPTFTIGGTVTGVSGAGALVLQDNGRDNLTVSADGKFQFAMPIPSGSVYDVTSLSVLGQQSQTCAFTNASGTVASSNITNVAIACKANAVVTLTVSGLAGTGLVLQDNGTDNLAIAANGTTTFGTALASGTPYDVTVLTQPTHPEQTCSVTGGTGTVIAGTPTAISVACKTLGFTIGATVSGLRGTGLVLQDNGGDNLPVSAAGNVVFNTPLQSGSPYAVTVAAQPSAPSQTCTVTGGAGTVGSGNVTGIAVTCVTNTYDVGGLVSGLTGAGLVLQVNGGDDYPVAANGRFTFTAPIASGAPYTVTVLTQPVTPSQTCVVSAGTGTVGAAAVTNVAVTCTTNYYTVGGTVTGLNGTGLVLQDNGGNNLPVTADGPFKFSVPILSGATYAVTVLTQPTLLSQTCTVVQPGTLIGAANVTTVAVNCTTNSYTVGGTVSGLPAVEPPVGLVLQNNLGDNLPAGATNTFTFAMKLLSGAPYSVTIFGEPQGYACAVANGTGTVTSADVTGVLVTCVATGGFAYVTNAGTTGAAGTISGFAIDENSGALVPLTHIVAPAGQPNAIIATTGANPSSATVGCDAFPPSPAVDYGTLYVANAGSNSVGAYSINADFTALAGGSLALLTNPPIASGTAPTHVDFNGDLCTAVVTDSGSSNVSAYLENTSNGALAAVAGSPFAVLPANQSIPVPVAAANATVFNSDFIASYFEYVVDRASAALAGYSVSNTAGSTGALTPLTNGNENYAPTPTGSIPDAVVTDVLNVAIPGAFTTEVSFIYVANQGDNTISVYEQDPFSNAIAAVGTAIATGSAPVALNIVSDVLYAANSSAGTLSSYQIDTSANSGTTGQLTSINAAIPTGANPVALSSVFIGNGVYLFVVNGGAAGEVYVYSVNLNASGEGLLPHGALTLVGIYPVGAAPTSIAIYTPREIG